MIKFFPKKILFSFLTIYLLSILLSPQIIFAETAKELVTGGLDTTAGVASLSEGSTDLPTMIGIVINYLFSILGVIFLTTTLIGGYFWMTAGGNEEKVEKGKKFIINGINGMIVVFLAYALTFVILSALGKAIADPGLPG